MEALEQGDVRATLTSDIIFTLLPIVVIVVVFTHYKGFLSVFRSPEFAFAAAVLFGQTIVKFIRISRPPDVLVGKLGLIQSLLVVVGLCPTLLVLLFLLAAEINATEPSKILMVSQMVLLFVSIIVYIVFGEIAEESIAIASSPGKH
jgi:hypothetical protein